MRLGTAIAAGAVLCGLIAAGAALWFFAFNDGPLTQVQGPGGVPAPQGGDQSTQPDQGQTTAARGSAAQPPWSVNCTNSQAGLDCRAIKTLFIKKTGQRFLTVAVRVPPGTKKPVMWIRVPLGTYLPAGVALQFGRNEAKAIPFQNCNRLGCLAAYAVTEAEIAAMLQGADVTVSIQNLKQRPITLAVPAGGFAEAYAKIR